MSGALFVLALSAVFGAVWSGTIKNPLALLSPGQLYALGVCGVVASVVLLAVGVTVLILGFSYSSIIKGNGFDIDSALRRWSLPRAHRPSAAAPCQGRCTSDSPRVHV